MVKDKDKGIFPESVTWAYAENLKVHEKAPTMTSEDPDFIRDIYYALSNTIVMGNAFERSTETPYFIEITLNNGGTIRYNFVSPSVIRLSEQNYVIESDGSLWRTLREASFPCRGAVLPQELVYDMDGNCCAMITSRGATTIPLPAGIYVIGGEKVLVK